MYKAKLSIEIKGSNRRKTVSNKGWYGNGLGDYILSPQYIIRVSHHTQIPLHEADLCLVLRSSEKLPPAIDGSKYRDPEPDITQRVRDLVALSPKRDISIKSLPL